MTVTAQQATSTIDPRDLIPRSLFVRLVDRVVKDAQLDQAYAERIMDQALGFLVACAVNPCAGLSPSGTVLQTLDPIAIWRDYAEDVTGTVVEDCGHFLAEEQPAEVLADLSTFLRC